MVIYTKKTTYHSVSRICSKNWLNNDYYELKGSIGEMNINETMQTQYYESKC